MASVAYIRGAESPRHARMGRMVGLSCMTPRPPPPHVSPAPVLVIFGLATAMGSQAWQFKIVGSAHVVSPCQVAGGDARAR